MAYENNLFVQYTPDDRLHDIDDQRWRKNKSGVSETGQNGTLDVASVGTGTHVVDGRYLLSGTPVFRDTDGLIKVWTSASTLADGVTPAEILGFTQSINKIVDVNGTAFGTIPVGIQTGGEIYPDWLPVDVADEDIPSRFGVSPL